MKTHSILLALMIVGLSSTVNAQSGPEQGNYQQQGRQGGGGHHQGPPPEAIAACKGKPSNAACSFKGRQGEQLSGQCFTPPAGGPGQGAGQGAGQSANNKPNQGPPPAACRPNRGPNQGQGGQGGGNQMR